MTTARPRPELPLTLYHMKWADVHTALRFLLAENERLRNAHTHEGTVRCTCNAYPHDPNCGLDERLVALHSELDDARLLLRACGKFGVEFDTLDGLFIMCETGETYIECEWHDSLPVFTDELREALRKAVG